MNLSNFNKDELTTLEKFLQTANKINNIYFCKYYFCYKMNIT